MEGFRVAVAYVVVEPDTDGFEDRLQAKLEAMDPVVRVRTVLEDDDLSEQAQAAADETDAVARVRTDVDAGDLEEKVQAAADESDAHARVGMEPDPDGWAEKVQAAADSEHAEAKVGLDPDAAEWNEKLQGAVDESHAQAEVPLGVAPGSAERLAAEAEAASLAAGAVAHVDIPAELAPGSTAKLIADADAAAEAASETATIHARMEVSPGSTGGWTDIYANATREMDALGAASGKAAGGADRAAVALERVHTALADMLEEGGAGSLFSGLSADIGRFDQTVAEGTPDAEALGGALTGLRDRAAAGRATLGELATTLESLAAQASLAGDGGAELQSALSAAAGRAAEARGVFSSLEGSTTALGDTLTRTGVSGDEMAAALDLVQGKAGEAADASAELSGALGAVSGAVSADSEVSAELGEVLGSIRDKALEAAGSLDTLSVSDARLTESAAGSLAALAAEDAAIRNLGSGQRDVFGNLGGVPGTLGGSALGEALSAERAEVEAQMNAIGDEMAKATEDAAKKAAPAAANAGKTTGGIFSHGLIANLAIAGVAGAPLVGAVIGGGLMAAILGVVIDKTPALKAAVSSSLKSVETDLAADVAPAAKEVAASFDDLTRSIAADGPEIQQVFAAAAPDIHDFLAGLGLGIHEFLPGFDAGLKDLHPAMQVAETDMGDLGKTLGDVFAAVESGGGAKALAQIVGSVVTSLDEALPPVLKLAGAVTQDLAPGLDAILPPLGRVIGDVANLVTPLARANPLVVDAAVAWLALRSPISAVSGMLTEAKAAWTGVAAAETEATAASDAAGASQAAKTGWITSLVGQLKEAQAAWKAESVAEDASAASGDAVAASSAAQTGALGSSILALRGMTAETEDATIAQRALAAAGELSGGLIAGAAVAVGIAAYAYVKYGQTMNETVSSMQQVDQATGYNVAGYQKLDTQLKSAGASSQNFGSLLKDAFLQAGSGATGVLTYAKNLGVLGSAQTAASAASTALTQHLHEIEGLYGTSASGAEHLAASAGVSAKALSSSGAAGQQAMQQIEAYATGLGEASGATSVAAQNARALALEEGILGSSTQSVTNKVTALGNAYSALINPQLNLMNNTVAYKQAQISLGTALTASHGKLGTQTAAERAATTATTAAASAALALSQNIEQQTGSSSKAVGPLESLVRQLERAGASGGGAAKLIAELVAQINALHSKTVDITIREQQIGSATASMAGNPHLHGAGGAYGGIVPHYGAGGVLPGYDPGHDTIAASVAGGGKVMLSGGEGIIVPEAVTKLGGPPGINAINAKLGGPRVRNALARGDGTSRLQHFASGGAVSAVQQIGTDTFNISVWAPSGWGAPGAGGGGGWGWHPGGGAWQGEGLDKLTPAQLKVMEKTGDALVHAFSDGSLKTLAQVKSEAATAIDAIRKYYSGAGQTQLVSSIRQQTGALEKLATKSQAIATEIRNMKSFASSVSSNLSSFSDLSSLTAPKSGEVASQIGTGIVQQLNTDLTKLHNFFGIIGQAKKAGLDKTFIEQAISLGPDAGYTYLKAALSGGKNLIAEINSDEASIAKYDKKIGQRAAEIQYGQSITKGFLSGLREKQGELDKEMRRLGDEIAKELAKALHVPKANIPAAVKHAGTRHHEDRHDHKGGWSPSKPASTKDIHITVNYNGKRPSAEDEAAAMRKLASAIGGVG